MALLPMQPADSAATAAAHLWHLTYQLGGDPGTSQSGPLDRWRQLAAELTILSEQLRARAAGRRIMPMDDGRQAHVAALRSAIVGVLDDYQSSARRAVDVAHRPMPSSAQAANPSAQATRCGNRWRS